MTRKPTKPILRPAGRLLAAAAIAAAIAWSGPAVFTQGPVRCSGTICIVSGMITANTTFEAANDYVLSGAVFVEEPAVLTIEPGTQIFGDSATNGTLVIAQGAQIRANGTAEAPIVMTSDQPVGQRARGDWGGLIINGRAPLNIPGGVGEGEGDTGAYGGDDPFDDSGILRYVRVEFAGTEFSPDNELNGIAFQGVGSRTVVDHVMVKFNKDDGLEFFGGTVGVKHVICFGIADDSFDWTDGWQGRGQFLIALQSGDDADQGIEADNNADNNNLEPRSNPMLYNVTLIGDPDVDEGLESDIGMLLREGTAATIRNFIVMGFKEAAIDIDHAATFAQVDLGALTLGSGIVFDNCSAAGCHQQFLTDEDDLTATWTTAEIVTYFSPYVWQVDPQLADPYNLAAPDFTPADDSPAVNGLIRPALTPYDGFFDIANFIGAVGPHDHGDGMDHMAWWQGWTDFSVN